jgi:hypothetical protein
MFSFLIVTVIFGVLVWAARKYIPEFGWIVAIVLVLIWIFRYLLPFLGVTL